MKLKKLGWIEHAGCPIYSVDIHCDGTRIATGGGDNKIKIWGVAAIKQDDENERESNPRILRVLENHQSSVNVVRWSPNGKLLASGSDDKVIFLWELSATPATVAFGSQDKIIENWRCVGQLRGHTLDISDLSWSPDGHMLASCSTDNSVMVWDVPRREMIKKLNGHSGWVKGVAWDPIGRYLASQGDDKLVIIWRTNDWGREATIDSPYKKSGSNTFFRRLSWSPTGSHLTTTQGIVNDKPTAVVLTRGSWDSSFNLMGHSLPVVCTRFSHQLYKRTSGPYAICALGSRDGAMSVWSTSSSRPIFVVKDLFEQSALDLSWSKEGDMLLGCGTDGTCAVCIFDKEELGERVSEAEFNQIVREAYGASSSVPAIAESTYQLDLDGMQLETTSEKPVEVAAPRPVAIPTVVQQKATRLPDGRKRITPQLIGGISDMETVSSPFGESQSSILPAPDIIASTPITPSPAPIQKEPISATKSLPTPAAPIVPSMNGIQPSSPPKEKRKPSSSSAEPPKKKVKSHKKEKHRHEKHAEKEEDKESPAVHVPKFVTRQPRIPPPAPNTKVTCRLHPPLRTTQANVAPIYVEASITEYQPNDVVSSVVCHTDKVIWENRIKSRATLLTGNSKFAAVGCDDGSIYTFSPTGRVLLPCLVLGDAVACLESSLTSHLMAISCSGNLFVWDIEKQQSLVATHDNTLAHLLGSNSLSKAQITKDGIPVVTLSSGDSFTFHAKMQTWMRIADTKSFSNSEFANRLKQNGGILAELQATARLARMPSIGVTPQQRNMETVAHLEHQVASALALHSPEYKQCLQTYVRRLASDGSESKLRELLSGFHSGSILDIPKRELLKELLPIINTNKSLQRLVNEFKDILSSSE